MDILLRQKLITAGAVLALAAASVGLAVIATYAVR